MKSEYKLETWKIILGGLVTLIVGITVSYFTNQFISHQDTKGINVAISDSSKAHVTVAGDSSIQNNNPVTISNGSNSTNYQPINSGSGTQNNDFGQKITVKRKITNASKVDQSVKTYNQSGGYAAHTIVIPEDQELDLKDNFIIQSFENRLIIGPKTGTWKLPFVSIPFNVKDSIECNWHMKGATIDFVSINKGFVITDKGEKIEMIMWQCSGSATSTTPYFFDFKRLPSFIAFGDASDDRKKYLINPNDKQIK